METVLTVKWRFIAMRGLIAVGFGLVMAIWPNITLPIAFVIFGLFVMLEGFATVFISFTRRSEDRWIPLAIGWASVLIGVFAVAWPTYTAGHLFWSAIVWALVAGTGSFVLAHRSLGDPISLLLFTFSGLVLYALALTLGISPTVGAGPIMTTVGVFAVVVGLVTVVLGFQLRRITGDLRKGKVTEPEAMP